MLLLLVVAIIVAQSRLGDKQPKVLHPAQNVVDSTV